MAALDVTHLGPRCGTSGTWMWRIWGLDVANLVALGTSWEAPGRGGEGGGAARRGARGGEAPQDFTKPQQTIQSPNRQYKAPTDYTNPLNIKQRPNILNKTLQY